MSTIALVCKSCNELFEADSRFASTARYCSNRCKAEGRRIPMPSKSELEHLYITERLSIVSISHMLDVGQTTVKRWISFYEIQVRKTVIPSEEELINLYHVEKKTFKQIGEMFGCTNVNVRHCFAKYGIQSRSSSEAQRVSSGTDNVSDEELKEAYASGMSLQDIYANYKVSPHIVRDILISNDVDIRMGNAGIRNGMYGRTHSQESRDKIRQANYEQFSRPGARERHAEITADQIANGRTGKSYNKLEMKFASILKQSGLEYKMQYRLSKYSYDFYVPSLNTIIEIHGTYWHADPRFYPDRSNLNDTQKRNILNDDLKSKCALDNGYDLLVFWEHDIDMIEV